MSPLILPACTALALLATFAAVVCSVPSPNAAEFKQIDSLQVVAASQNFSARCAGGVVELQGSFRVYNEARSRQMAFIEDKLKSDVRCDVNNGAEVYSNIEKSQELYALVSQHRVKLQYNYNQSLKEEASSAAVSTTPTHTAVGNKVAPAAAPVQPARVLIVVVTKPATVVHKEVSLESQISGQ